jgi:hypothetical protein
VLGYTARIIRESPDEPPKLSDYWKLFVDGLLVFIKWVPRKPRALAPR